MPSDAVLFDLGGVVLSWDPRGAYERVLPAEEVATFLERVDFAGWNRLNDGGRSFEEAEQELIARFPDDREAILGYRIHFDATLTGMVPGTSKILAELGQAGVRLIALTNWSAETFPFARDRFPFLDWFESILVSADVGLIKPDPRIFELLLERIGRTPAACVYIDDNAKNAAAAAALGFDAIAFRHPDQLRDDLTRRDLLAGSETR
jgi:2-haloacid dehalogenase